MAQRKNKAIIRTEYLFAETLLVLLRWLPMRMAGGVSALTTKILDKAIPKLRRAARINLSFAFPELEETGRERIIDGVFRSIGRLLLALARLPDITRANVGEWIEYDGLEHYLAAKAQGTGVLVATAHLGNWELSAFAHAWMTEPMHVMVRPLDNPLIDAVVERRRAISGNFLVAKTDAARAVLRALKANEAVGILIDQNTAASEGMFIQFFGRAACAGTGFVKLALHSGAAVVPGFALWDEGRRKYILRFYPQIPLSGDVYDDTQRLHSFIEERIREYPDQWMWIHRRWKTRPPGEGPIY